MEVDTDRYPALESLSAVYSIVGWLIAVVGGLIIIALVYLYAFDDALAEVALLVRFASVFGALLIFGLGALIYFSVAELIRLGVDLEANTRRTSDLISQLHTAVTRQSTDRPG